MDIQAIQKLLHDRFGAVVGHVASARLFDYIEVAPDRIDDVAYYVATEPALLFDSLSNLSACDYPQRGKIQIVYDLYSYTHDHTLVLKVDADRANPRVATVERVWPAANWHEREAYDLLGVVFTGHSDLRRILLPDDWVGHPLRKDYVEAPDYHGISTIRESVLNVPGRN
ncbi:MAG TPA: NADH-quinone oxidoreductase subunit C [Candidatus Limnocylindrales bacterium]|nr:NADH-quinone oxidoreductase subunit C [Candidatus Limnocylindrales bacterium]